MRAPRPARWICVAGALLTLALAATTSAYGQPQVLARRVAVLDQQFSVDTARGDRDVVEFAVTQTGQIRVQAIWTGSARRLAMILNGPGQTGYYARQDGASPLTIEFTVGREELRRGKDWKISLVNFGGGKASGRLLIEYPGQRLLQLVQPVAPELQPVQPAPEAPAAEPEKTILEDGIIETRYPDGSVRRQRVGECGYTITLPDNRQMNVQCQEVQTEEVPDLPADLLARDDVSQLLEAVGQNLLGYIRQAVGDESAVENYMQLEEGKNLQQRIFLRFEALSLLIP